MRYLEGDATRYRATLYRGSSTAHATVSLVSEAGLEMGRRYLSRAGLSLAPRSGLGALDWLGGVRVGERAAIESSLHGKVVSSRAGLLAQLGAESLIVAVRRKREDHVRRLKPMRPEKLDGRTDHELRRFAWLDSTLARPECRDREAPHSTRDACLECSMDAEG